MQIAMDGGGLVHPLDFPYFAFTIGTSFATSDVEVLGGQGAWRRAAAQHRGLLYNSLVIAIAFPVWQGLISR